MVTDAEIKNQVRQFYDQVGWQEASAGFYQNASYEDLRPVAQEYIHKCHLRVLRHINPSGHLLLDAGSGPIQYPEYLEYSRGYQQRVCADISCVALVEARKRIGSHGLFVVCDIANLPFKSESFDGLVSLHTIHHLPAEEHARAYYELYRMLAPGGRGAVVNGWDNPPLTRWFNFWVRLVYGLRSTFRRRPSPALPAASSAASPRQAPPRGTFVRKHDAAWLLSEVGTRMPISIWCWRSVNVHFLRSFIHPHLAGKLALRFIYWMEERFPHFFGRYGQYPIVELVKTK